MMKRLGNNLFSLLVILICICLIPINSYAEEDYAAQAEQRKKITIESNLIDKWPAGPEIGAESAILIEANTGIVLYEKNINEHLYPASITKILTALVAYDNCDMKEMVTFSYDAVNSIDWRYDANMGINGGSSITMEDTLYGMLVGSANEAAYAIAEHVAGNGKLDEFAKLMNEKAISLGCTDSNFVTPNGIHDSNHYTSAHDMALIAKAFFANEYLSNIACTPSYKFAVTDTQPKENMVVYAKSKLFPGKEYAYSGLVGTKTGYTEYARQTLVSCAERDGMKLICVIMKEEAPNQYADTIDLFNYGFSNFSLEYVAEKDSRFNISSSNLFNTDIDIFGSSKPILQMDPNSYIVLPKGSDLSQTTYKINYDDLSNNEVVKIDYYYSDALIGSSPIIASVDDHVIYEFDDNYMESNETENYIFVNIIKVIAIIIGIAIVLVVIFLIISAFRNSYKFKKKNSNTNKKYNYKNKHLKWKHLK